MTAKTAKDRLRWVVSHDRMLCGDRELFVIPDPGFSAIRWITWDEAKLIYRWSLPDERPLT